LIAAAYLMAAKIVWENRGGTFALYALRIEGRWKEIGRFALTWPKVFPHLVRTKSFAKASLAHVQQILSD
jgi:hypothetical protein